MKSSFRWYGESDPVKLEYIRQIPGMRSIVSAVYDVKPGEVWPEESIRHLTELCREHGLIFDVVDSGHRRNKTRKTGKRAAYSKLLRICPPLCKVWN